MLAHQYPIHRFLHTTIGATLAGIATWAVFAFALRLSSRVRLPNWFRWQELSNVQVALGAAAGCYSHVLLDSFVHSDVAPFWPLTDANPALGVVSRSTVIEACIAAGLIAIGLIGIRRMLGWRL
jgi:membrane-bound metal-dependent hydrolase YbcI (DUF457 family)